MSTIEDLRNLLQEIVAPDMKEVHARLNAIEGRIDRLDASMNRLEQQQDKFEARLEKRFDEVMAGINHLLRYNVLESRIEQLERRSS